MRKVRLTLNLLHHVLDILFQCLVRTRKQSQSILLDLLEILRRIDPSLIQDTKTRFSRPR